MGDAMKPSRAVTTSTMWRHETTPGELMKVGWSEVSYKRNGSEHQVFVFVTILSYSRMCFVMFAKRADVSTLIRCMMAAIKYFGGVPRAIATNQAQGMLSKKDDGMRRANPLIVDFADSLGIALQTYAPPAYDLEEEKVERRAGIVFGGAKVAPEAGRWSIDLDYLNHQALTWCDQLNHRPHASTHQSPNERLAKDRLAPMPNVWEWERFRIEETHVSRSCRLYHHSARYQRSREPQIVDARTPEHTRVRRIGAWHQRRHVVTLANRRRSRRTEPGLNRLRAAFTTLAAQSAADPARQVALENATITSAPVTAPSAWDESSLVAAPLPPGHLRNIFVRSMPLPTQAQLHAKNAAEARYWERWGAAQDGARIVVTRPQKYVLLLSTMTTSILLYERPHSLLVACVALITALYIMTGMYKIWLLARGERAIAGDAAGAQLARDDDLPVYTVMVPLHREGKMLPVLVERLKSIDYPPDRLQILLLIEMDDEETQEAARKCPLPVHISPMIMPPGQPRTKPRALNVGLHEARGEYIVIYDAEDRPERDQLRKAVAAFRTLPEDVICVQGRLNFYNGRQSLLTRLFAVDYAVWYDQFLPGLALSGRLQSGAFVPLGGTSNHFRVAVLRQVGGWDPFNVTEDCDLGARLGRAGLRVAMLDSITWEEAVPRVRPWIRQRSRWIKGYLQTYLVHMRHPMLLLRQLGLRGFIDFQMLVGASCLVVLVNPLMWALTIAYVAGRGTLLDSFIETLLPAPLYYFALLSLVVGNFIFFYCNAYVCVRHDHINLTRCALLTPAYWILMSVGAWAGLISLIRNPHYWAKTEHGVSLSHSDGSAALVDQIQAG